MAQKGAITGPAVRNTVPDANDWGLVVRVIGGIVIVGPILVDQNTFPWIVEDDSVGTLHNGAETAVSNVAISVLAANATRKSALIQNNGNANVRVGVAGVTPTTGLRLKPGDIAEFNSPYIVQQEIFAIREGTKDSVVFAQEVTKP